MTCVECGLRMTHVGTDYLECADCGTVEPRGAALEQCDKCGRLKGVPGCSHDETECECCWCYRDGRGA